MERNEVGSWEMVERFFDASVRPERLHELIGIGDAQIPGAAPRGAVQPADSAGSAFAQQVAGVLGILERPHAAELRRVNGLLSEIRTAAMVLADDGQVVAANAAARVAFGLEPGGSLGTMPLDATGIAELAERVAEVAGGAGREAIVQLHPAGLDRVLMVHLKAMPSGSRAQVMAITSELVWPGQVSEFLARAFALTAAEIEVMRLLTAGGTVTGIACATRRTPGTVRSQLHAILQKTGTRGQAEAVRLALLLLESARVDPIGVASTFPAKAR